MKVVESVDETDVYLATMTTAGALPITGTQRNASTH